MNSLHVSLDPWFPSKCQTEPAITDKIFHLCAASPESRTSVRLPDNRGGLRLSICRDWDVAEDRCKPTGSTPCGRDPLAGEASIRPVATCRVLARKVLDLPHTASVCDQVARPRKPHWWMNLDLPVVTGIHPRKEGSRLAINAAESEAQCSASCNGLTRPKNQRRGA